MKYLRHHLATLISLIFFRFIRIPQKNQNRFLCFFGGQFCFASSFINCNILRAVKVAVNIFSSTPLWHFWTFAISHVFFLTDWNVRTIEAFDDTHFLIIEIFHAMCLFVFCETWIFPDDSFAFFLSPANLTEFYSSKKLFVDDFFYSSRQLPIKSTFFVCDNCRNMQDDFNGPLRKPLIGFIDFCDMFLYENKTFFPLNFHRKYWFKLIETVTFSHLYVMGHVVGCAWFLAQSKPGLGESDQVIFEHRTAAGFWSGEMNFKWR